MVLKALFLTSALVAPAMALAEPPPPPPPAGEQIEELIVTAERREASLQNVPVPVTALSAAALEGSNITSTEGLTTKVPGLLMTQTLNASQPYIRGVGAENTVPGTEASVATYVDGVYVASITGSLFGLNNVKRIEVLRGPQGTLFGRNATGGLVQVITAVPSYDPQGNVSVSYGSFDTWTGDAYVTGPLSKTLAADFAVSGVNQGEGYGRNLTRGNEVYKRRELNGRTKLRFTPADNLTATLAADYGWQDSDAGNTRSIAPGTVAFGGFRPTANPYDTISAGGPLGTKTQGGASLKIEYQFGGVNLTSLTASRSYLSRFDFDQANIPLPLAQAYFHDPERTWQQEFVLQGSKPRLDWTAGAIYFGDAATLNVYFASGLSPPTNFKLFGHSSLQSYAGFGQATYEIFNETRVTLGGRYTHDTQDAAGGVMALAGNPLPAGTILLDREGLQDKRGGSTWRVAVDHRFSENLMTYVSVNRGFKTGGYSITDVTSPAIKPEILTDYEAGAKLDGWDRRVRLDLSAFHYDYKEIQTARVSGAGLLTIVNAASASVDGGELEAEFVPPVPLGELQIRATAALLRARYKSFPNAPIFVPNPGVCTPTPHVTGPPTGGSMICQGDVSGNHLIKAPDQTESVAIDYTIPVGRGQLSTHADYYLSSRFYFAADNRLSQPSYGVGNAQIAYSTPGGLKVRVFVANFTDKLYYVEGFTTTLEGDVTPAPPRTFGFGVDHKF